MRKNAKMSPRYLAASGVLSNVIAKNTIYICKEYRLTLSAKPKMLSGTNAVITLPVIIMNRQAIDATIQTLCLPVLNKPMEKRESVAIVSKTTSAVTIICMTSVKVPRYPSALKGNKVYPTKEMKHIKNKVIVPEETSLFSLS